jgi:DNA-binding response OmpR family regulator
MVSNPTNPSASDRSPKHRLNLLLSRDERLGSDRAAIDQLLVLVSPLGIRSIVVSTGEEAAEVIGREPIHVAFVDLAMPIARDCDGQPGGSRVLQLLRRLDQPPPTVVLRPPHGATRDRCRLLGDALREGAFAVIDRPLRIETMLEVMRRIIRRHYRDHWPAA